MPQHGDNGHPAGNGSIDADEHTSLLNRHGSNPARSALNKMMWYRSDRRVWVRVPSEAFYLSYATLVSNYVNILLIFVPLGIASKFAGWNPTTTFILNFLAIIPLASLLSFATEELAATLGETLGGLLNATFGNAVELIVSLSYSPIEELRLNTGFPVLSGQYHCATEERDSDRPSQYAWQHSIEHSPGARLLLLYRRSQTP